MGSRVGVLFYGLGDGGQVTDMINRHRHRENTQAKCTDTDKIHAQRYAISNRDMPQAKYTDTDTGTDKMHGQAQTIYTDTDQMHA